MKQSIQAVAVLVAAAVLGAGGVIARAQSAEKPAEPPPGRILFVRGDALLSTPGDGKGSETEVVKLPAEVGTVTSMESSPDGGLIVVRGDKGSAWLNAGESTWHTGCPGRARPSPTSECLICEAGGTVTLIGAKKTFAVKLPGTFRDVNFLGSARELAVLDAQKGVLGFGVRTPKETRVLARPGANGYLLVAPDGSKAVAVLGHGAASRVHGFVLDGEGVPRSLGGPAVPVVWSTDSTWVLIQYGVPSDETDVPGSTPLEDDGSGDEGDEDNAGEGGGEGRLEPAPASPAPWLLATPGGGKKAKSKKSKKADRADPPARVRTCVVRAIGGESKCWNHFAPRAVAPSNDRVLLWKDASLWVGKIPGVRPDPPRRVVEKADGPAIWVP